MFVCLIIILQSKGTWRLAVRPRFSSCARVWRACEGINGVGLGAVFKRESMGRDLLGVWVVCLELPQKIDRQCPKDNTHHFPMKMPQHPGEVTEACKKEEGIKRNYVCQKTRRKPNEGTLRVMQGS